MKNIFNKEWILSLISKIGDKNMHLLCCFTITLLIGLFNLFVGIVVGILVGITKELYDLVMKKLDKGGTGFDEVDLMYDIIGVAIATAVLLVI